MRCLLVVACGSTSAGAITASAHEVGIASVTELRAEGWVWPAAHFRQTRPFVQPAHEYAAGHRGIDLDLMGTSEILAPADGVIAFTGSVGGRTLVTIEHSGDLVTTLEPVQSTLSIGTAVHTGDVIGVLSTGGHTAHGSLHFGVRLRGEYINPLALLGDIPRAILLPCCE